MTKKRSSEIFGVKMEIFPLKKSLKNFSVPQTQRQVSAYAFASCCITLKHGDTIERTTAMFTLTAVTAVVCSRKRKLSEWRYTLLVFLHVVYENAFKGKYFSKEKRRHLKGRRTEFLRLPDSFYF